MIRKVLIGAAVVVLVAGAVTLAVRSAPSQHGERVDGPRGDYPAAIGDRAPERPAVTLPGTTEPEHDGHGHDSIEDPIILGGLRISGDDNITAHDLRTGEEHWTYQRDGAHPDYLAVADGALFVLWGDGLLVRFDPRDAEVVWHREIGDPAFSRDLVAAGNTVVAIRQAGPHPFRGYAIDDGAKRWEAPQPTCRNPGDVTVVGGVLVMSVECSEERPGDTSGIVALDGESGDIRWQREGTPTAVEPVDDTRVAASSLRDRLTVYSVRDGRRIDTAALPGDVSSVTGPGDPLVVRQDQPHRSNGRVPKGVALAGWNVSGGERAWTVETDGTWRVASYPHVADGLAYVVRHHLDDPHREFTLTVYDVATGTEVSRTDIPIRAEVRTELPDETISVTVHEARAGVVSLRVSPLVDGAYHYVLLAQDENQR